jgi:hypothetical protein
MFHLVLWIGFPIITFALTVIINIVTQYSECKQTNIGRAMLGALPSFGTIFIALGVSSISYCRIPIASVFAPMIIGQSVNITKNKSTTNVNSLKNNISKECCIPKLSLELIEQKYPLIVGISYGFYVMFSMLFGMVIGSGLSSIC